MSNAKAAYYLILVFLRLDLILASAGTTTVGVLGLAVVVVDSTVVEAGAVCIGSTVVVVVAGVVVV